MSPIKSSLADKLKNVKNPHKGRAEPLWTGPDGKGPTGGVTQGLLSGFLCCRERFRLHTIEGIKSKEGFNSRMEYGNLWHIAEQALADGGLDPERQMKAYARELCSKYPFQREEIDHWYRLAKTFFPLYVQHWQDHPDVKNRTPLLQEYSFDVPYQLPSGRMVRMRGKWDSVDLVTFGKQVAIWLQENKTKSTIKQEALYNQLSSGFDLQTMFYLIALRKHQFPDGVGKGKRDNLLAGGAPIAGVRYNVIRRPAHKTVESALKKYTEDVENNRIGEWFLRMKVEITNRDLERFQRECLDPLLEQLWDWWEWIGGDEGTMETDPFRRKTRQVSTGQFVTGVHYRTPFGIWNPLIEGAPTDLDRLMDKNDMTGLEHVQVLFPELEESS